MLTFDIARNLPQHQLRFRARLPQEPTTTALWGANGSGKSLLLSMLAGIEQPDKGRISFGKKLFFDKNHNLPPEQRHIGYAFQEARLFPHMSVLKNLNYAQRMNNFMRLPFRKASLDFSPSASRKPALYLYEKARAKERNSIIEAFSLSSLLNRYPSRLSGGEQQRVALARALLAEPRLLLLDEPLSSMDRRHKRQALAFLQGWLQEKQLPCIYVSHDIEEVACLATHAMVVAQTSGKEKHKGERIARSLIAIATPIAEATTAINTSRQTGASPVAVVPVLVQQQRALDGLWRVAFTQNPDASFLLSTHDGATPTNLCRHQRTTHARIRAEDVLFTEHDNPNALEARLLALSPSHDGIAQITCAGQRLLMRLSSQQRQRIKAAKNLSLHVRIRKAQGGIL